MNRQLPLLLAAGLVSALLFLSLVKGIAMGALLSYVAPLPLIMVGLAQARMTASAVAGAVGIAAVALGVGGFSSLSYVVTAVVPALVVVNRAILGRVSPDGSVEWYPPGLILSWLTAVGLALMCVGVLLMAEHPDGVRGWVADLIARVMDLIAADIPRTARAQAVRWWTPLFPAMVTASWLVMAVVNASMAQGLTQRLGWAKRPRPAYGQLWLPDWLAAVAVAAGGVWLVSGGDLEYLAVNVLCVMVVPFLFLGLAGIHRWAGGRPNAGVILAVTYGLLILVFGWAALAVAGLGLARFLRSRFRHPDSGGMEG